MELKHDKFERDSLKMWPQNLKVMATRLDTNSEKTKLIILSRKPKKGYLSNYFRDNSGNIKNIQKGINAMLGNESKNTAINEFKNRLK